MANKKNRGIKAMERAFRAEIAPLAAKMRDENKSLKTIATELSKQYGIEISHSNVETALRNAGLFEPLRWRPPKLKEGAKPGKFAHLK